MRGRVLGGFSKYRATRSDLKLAQVHRSMFSNKYSSGSLLVIGGSSKYYGAPLLALNSAYQSLAALRVGAGYAKAFVPRSILGTARSLSPNTVIEPSGAGYIEFSDAVRQGVDSSRAVILGMGMGNGKKQLLAAKGIIKYALGKGKMVIVDADAIQALKSIGSDKAKNLLATPHDGEFLRLTGIRPDARNIGKRIKAAKQASSRYGTIILLKGHDTVITDGKMVKVVHSKSAALATMGTGDVLSGIIGGYAATGMDLFKAAVAGAFLHSVIGDSLYRKKGSGAIATDIIEDIPRAIKRLSK